jgi:hypothetical protein
MERRLLDGIKARVEAAAGVRASGPRRLTHVAAGSPASDRRGAAMNTHANGGR